MFKINFDQVLLTKALIKQFLELFWKKVMADLSDDQIVCVLLKIQFNNGQFSSLGSMQKIFKFDLIKLFQLYIDLIEIKSNEYKTTNIQNLIIVYSIVPKNKILLKKTNIIPKIENKLNFYSYLGFVLIYQQLWTSKNEVKCYFLTPMIKIK